MSQDSLADFGFGWDPTLQVGPSQETVLPAPKVVSEAVGDKICFLQMQQAIFSGDDNHLKQLLDTTPLKVGQKRALCRLVLKHFTPTVAAVLKDFPWNEVVKQEMLLSAIKKDQWDAFNFMVDHLNTYELKFVCTHLMDVTAGNFELYDKYRPAVFSRLTSEHQQYIAERFALNLRAVKASKAEVYYNLAASVAHLDWKEIFASSNLYTYTSIGETWGWGWMLKEFPSVHQQYQQLVKDQKKFNEEISSLVEKIVLLVPLESEKPLHAGYHTRKPEHFFTEEFIKLCKDTPCDINRIYQSIGELGKLHRSHGVKTSEILMYALKYPTLNSSDLEGALKVMYEKTYKKPLVTPMSMLSNSLEKILFGRSNEKSVMDLLSSAEGKSALREFFNNPMHLRLFAHHASRNHEEIGKVLRNIDVFKDRYDNTLMHYIAPQFFNKVEAIKPWILDARANWEDKNSQGFSPKDIAYQYEGAYNQSLLDEAEEIFNQRANNVLNKNLKQQLGRKKTPSFKRKM